MSEIKKCSSCARGTLISVNSDILCRIKGVVSPDYVCSKHLSMPGQKSGKDMKYKCIDCENFLVDPSNPKNNGAIGLCRLFSVRQYNGYDKNACSKFVKISGLEELKSS